MVFFSRRPKTVSYQEDQPTSNVSTKNKSDTGTSKTQKKKNSEAEEARDEVHPITAFLDSTYLMASDTISVAYSEVQSTFSNEPEEDDDEDNGEDTDKAGRRKKVKKVRGNAFTLAKLIERLDKQELKLEQIGEQYDETELKVKVMKQKISLLSDKKKVGFNELGYVVKEPENNDEASREEAVDVLQDEVDDAVDAIEEEFKYSEDDEDYSDDEDEINDAIIGSEYIPDDFDDASLSGKALRILDHAGDEMIRLTKTVESAANDAIFPHGNLERV